MVTILYFQTEAALLIEPALATMTESEIHSVMTAGFACIAGSLFAAYIAFGVFSITLVLKTNVSIFRHVPRTCCRQQ